MTDEPSEDLQAFAGRLFDFAREGEAQLLAGAVFKGENAIITAVMRRAAGAFSAGRG
jgi:hypothetical protein